MKWFFRTLVVFLLLLLIAAAGRRIFVMPDIANHKGDGKFEDISRRTGPFAMPGYSVTFPEIDLSRKHVERYRFSALPNIGYGYECNLYFVVPDADVPFPPPGGRNLQLDVGSITLELADSKGNVLVDMKGRPIDFIWCRIRQLNLLYQFGHLRFQPDASEDYTLKVAYEPSPAFLTFKGYAYIECGGNK